MNLMVDVTASSFTLILLRLFLSLPHAILVLVMVSSSPYSESSTTVLRAPRFSFSSRAFLSSFASIRGVAIQSKFQLLCAVSSIWKYLVHMTHSLSLSFARGMRILVSRPISVVVDDVCSIEIMPRLVSFLCFLGLRLV